MASLDLVLLLISTATDPISSSCAAMEVASNTPPSSPHSPCAACKVLRRRCSDKCALAPYFPPAELLKFTNAHRVFGASNIVKCLQELPESRRADAASSLVYEANARIRDPVYGSAGIVFQLQKQVRELESLVARAQAELATVRSQRDNLVGTVVCLKASCSSSSSSFPTEVLEEFYSPAACQASMWEEHPHSHIEAWHSFVRPSS